MADRNLRLQVILEGLDRITAPLKSITGASSAARKDLAETHKQLKALDALQQQVGKYKAAESRFADDNRQYQESQTRLAALRAQLDATEKPTKKLRDEFARTEKQSAHLANRIENGGTELQRLSAKLSSAGIDVADLAHHEDRLAAKTAQANQALRKQTAQLEKVAQANRNSEKLNAVSQKATGMGLGMVAAGTAAGAPIVMATRQAMTLESAMADVSKVTNMAQPAIERMSNDFLDMSETIPMAANELAQIAAAAGAAGVGMDKLGNPLRDQRKQLLAFTNDAAEMGVAFDMTADVAGETMAKWRTAFELPQAGVRALGDRVNALTNSFGGKAANVTDIITRIGPLGKVAGLAAPEIAALGSTLDSIGVQSEVASTGIKNTMLALTKGEAATKSQRAAYQALGLDAVKVSKRMQKDAAGAIIDVMERIGKLDVDKQAGILTQLFGSESVSAIAPMLTNLDGLKARLALVGDTSKTAGSMHAEFLNRIATTEGATGLATNALSGLNITMGNALLPTVVALANHVRAAASAMRGWAQAHPALAKGIMIFMGAGAALLILLGGIALAFAALTAAAAPLGIALGPLLLIVAAIATLAAVAYLIYDNWGAISAWFGGLWQGIKAMVSEAIGFLIDAFLTFTPLGLLIRAFMPALAYLRSLNFTEIGRNLIQGLIKGVTDRLGALKSTIVGAASAVANWFKEKLGIHSPSRVFAGLGGFVMDGLDQGLADNATGPLGRISDLSDHMTERLKIASAGQASGNDSEGWSALLSRIATMSGQISSAIAAGSVAPAMAAIAPPVASSANRADGGASAPVSATYTITIHANAAPAQDIARQVREAIEQMERERRGRSFADD
ncbi:phage tail tape measure protein [Sphingobium sp. BYY-5]|uniref:phage tail tape measure protein n=1 Tax=Sphingobium sp. BYY-5 TaxID=2926400 RepID=UPI001FA739BD|nr:phage tail tape measure protein [Sphingobium sp. BYY-5]MCI4588598.1 phage tail tape measure protein [Sphingobium sp. BYY-5]